MRYLTLLALLTTLIASGGTARAQVADEGYLIHGLTIVEGYYALYGSSRLVQAQLLLQATGRYSGPLDGTWGADTAAAFRDVLATRMAIGGYGMGVYSPDDVPEILDWIGSVILAKGGYGDFPD